MSNQRVRELLDELTRELETTVVDESTRQAIDQFDLDLSAMAQDSQSERQQASALLEKAQELEVQFATRHPFAERLMQEIVGILSRMGI